VDDFPNSIPATPAADALSLGFYKSRPDPEELDDAIWLYLCGLVPEDERPYDIRVKAMLHEVSPELKRYYLTRGFDWERGSGGLESCMMREEDELFLEETISAYESLGATEHAAIIRELIPLAKQRLMDIETADSKGEEFDFDDGFWDSYEERWDKASNDHDFYAPIWQEIKDHPERYIHEI